MEHSPDALNAIKLVPCVLCSYPAWVFMTSQVVATLCSVAGCRWATLNCSGVNPPCSPWAKHSSCSSHWARQHGQAQQQLGADQQQHGSNEAGATVHTLRRQWVTCSRATTRCSLGCALPVNLHSKRNRLHTLHTHTSSQAATLNTKLGDTSSKHNSVDTHQTQLLHTANQCMIPFTTPLNACLHTLSKVNTAYMLSMCPSTSAELPTTLHSSQGHSTAAAVAARSGP
jgi:hypothetical protein